MHHNLSIVAKSLEEAAASTARNGGKKMRKGVQLIKRLGEDEEGAALVEYTVLLGIMLVAVITTIGLVGGWMSNKWTALWTALQAN
jgi:pilus assembly protein Flp/PilA